MLGWAIGFFIAALVAAVFGFGNVATAFTGVAIVMFWVFLALFVLSLLFKNMGGSAAAGHGVSGGLFAVVALVGGVALLSYAWIDNGMSAERVGRSIDRSAMRLAESTSNAVSRVGERADRLTQEATDTIAGPPPPENAAPEEEDDRSN